MSEPGPEAATTTPRVLRVALVGDRDDTTIAHRAIPLALELASRAEGLQLDVEWVPTDSIRHAGPRLVGFDGVWCVPVSPYRSTEGALAAIRFARERGVPFLGTCAGFQHAIIECARSLWGVADAGHAELTPASAALVITPLACPLVEQGGTVTFAPASRLAAAYRATRSEEEYHCSYGLAASARSYLENGPLRATAWDLEGDVRGVELDGHPFFAATLFQPERAALRGEVPKVVGAFVRAVARRATSSLYSSTSRELQDRFDTRRLADRLAEVKVHDALTPEDRAFIERLDMFFLASVDELGRPTCSYKGGDPGFVTVLGERSIAFPSYDGNGMFLSLGNLAATHAVGLLFIDFQEPRRMRVEGRARIDLDHPLLAQHREAQLVVVVDVERVYPNCGRYIHKYQLVERSRFVPHTERPTPVPSWKQAEWAVDVLPKTPPPGGAARGGEA
jgi:predicted pyridoxine 5'-phosphate oxidase superfamily flavin-nucleotide-binding protein